MHLFTTRRRDYSRTAVTTLYIVYITQQTDDTYVYIYIQYVYATAAIITTTVQEH